MRKNLLVVSMLTVVMMIISSCENNHHTTPSQQGDVTIIDDPSQLASRLVFGADRSKKVQRQKTVQQVAQPSIPAGALLLKDQPTNWNNGVTLTRGKAYYIDSEWKGTISQDWNSQSGSIDIYLAANAEITGAWW